jgi:DNA-binding transcriptional MerR regulator/methylmalonyl-CoA mutase cobalamin-binding subunit
VNDRTALTAITLSISAVERDTGLSKDTLRVWERRYGFPVPGRDAIGERVYPLEQVEKLRMVKRLLDAGHRPGRIVPLPLMELQHLADKTVDQPTRAGDTPGPAVDVRPFLDLLREHDPTRLHREMKRVLTRLGLERFMLELVGPLNAAVGDAWIRGQMEIFEEHHYTETLQNVFRQAIADMPEPHGKGRPRVLLTTFPGEPHGMGLLMAEAMMALEGCLCISLGVQTPLWDIVLAAQAYRADVVALSFTGCMNPNQVVDGLTELRAKLPPKITIWAGGSAPVLHRRRIEGVEPFDAHQSIPGALKRWRDEVVAP